MNYLSPSEYETYGLEEATGAAWVAAASAVMDAHCRRATLGVAQYQERLRVPWGRHSVRLSFLPLAVVAPATTPIVAARGRYAQPRSGEGWNNEMTWDVAGTFALPGSWVDIAPLTLDANAESGELTLPLNALGLGYGEIELTYTAGLAPLADAVKVACAQIVRNAQATPALNVKSGRLERMHLEYFADSLLDQTVRSLLAPYVAQKVG
jgi:hypothetical protein